MSSSANETKNIGNTRVIPIDWFKAYLARRNLSKPHGEALYTYRTKDNEYDDLQDVLKKHLLNVFYWDACFVLYAAEWWRRNYKQGTWTWEPIFESINTDSPHANKRQEIIESGLGRWECKVSEDGNKRYLASIIIQGGLPIETLHNNSWLKSVLCESFKRYQTGFKQTDSSLLIKNCAQSVRIPQSMQCDEIYSLLAEMVKRLSNLKRDYHLREVDNPIKLLDKIVPDWRNDFPLPIESEIGSSFINELLSEVVKIAPSLHCFFRIHRILKRTISQSYLSIQIESGAQMLRSKALLGISQQDIDSWPSKFDVILEGAYGEKIWLATAYKTFRDGELFIRHSLISERIEVETHNPSGGFKLLFFDKDKDVNLYRLSIPGGEPLEKDVPWVFTEKCNTWWFEGQASYQCKAELAGVLINGEVVDIDNTEGSWEKIEEIEGLGVLYHVVGKTAFITRDGEKYLIQTSLTETSSISYVLEGFSTLYTSNIPLFIEDSPRLYSVDQHLTRQEVPKNQIQIKPIGFDQIWCPLDVRSEGVMLIRLIGKQHGETLFRKKIALLPSDFTISLLGDETSPSRGRIRLIGCQEFQVCCEDMEICKEILSRNDGFEIILEAVTKLPPDEIIIILTKNGVEGQIKIRVPFPATGVRLFDAKGRALEAQDRLFLDQLHGVRAYLFKSPTQSIEQYHLRFKLNCKEIKDTGDLYQEFKGSIEKYYREITLIHYKDAIQMLFSLSSNLDATVSLEISPYKSTGISIEIQRYSTSLKRDHCLGGVVLQPANPNPSDLEHTELRALPFFNLEQPSEMIVPVLSQTSNKREWIFDENRHQAGSWLLYPDEKSRIRFRSTVWLVKSNASPDIPSNQYLFLEEVISITNSEIRLEQLKRVISLMAHRFDHPGWKTLDLLWESLNGKNATPRQMKM